MADTFPPELYASQQIDTVTAKDGEVFRMVLGLDRDLVEQVRARSLDTSDTELQVHTSDPQRFGTSESYEAWYRKGRAVFALTEEGTGKLAALVWLGPKPLGRKSLRFLSEEERAAEGSQASGEWHTIVYRTYPPFRGRGLIVGFLKKSIDTYMRHYPTARLWAGIALDNPASIAVSQKLGFVRKEELVDTEHNWLAMVREQ